ncbi:MAG: hypothetical protein WC282_04340, partial [Bacilli bacterium]
MEIAHYEKRIGAYLIDLLMAFAAPMVLAIYLYFQIPNGASLPLYFYFLAVELATYFVFIIFTFLFMMISR